MYPFQYFSADILQLNGVSSFVQNHDGNSIELIRMELKGRTHFCMSLIYHSLSSTLSVAPIIIFAHQPKLVEVKEIEHIHITRKTYDCSHAYFRRHNRIDTKQAKPSKQHTFCVAVRFTRQRTYTRLMSTCWRMGDKCVHSILA